MLSFAGDEGQLWPRSGPVPAKAISPDGRCLIEVTGLGRGRWRVTETVDGEHQDELGCRTKTDALDWAIQWLAAYADTVAGSVPEP